MPSSEPAHAHPASERRTRWIAIGAVILLVPCTIAATGWRDWREVRHTRELQAIDVPMTQAVDYDGAAVRLVGANTLPPDPGLPADRTFLRTRLLVEPRRPGTQWLGCTMHVVDAGGRSWAAIDTVPDLLQRAMAKPGEPAGASCDGLAVSAAKPGSKVVIDGYYLIPRPVPSDLRVTLSTREGRPAYLRLSQGTVQ